MTVTWTNRDVLLHTVTAKGGGVDSGALSKGTSYSRTFAEPGRFDFLCVFHPTMTGTVVVR